VAKLQPTELLASKMPYDVLSQNAKEVQDLTNAPALTVGPYLLETGQTHLLSSISIYSARGESREQLRLLYMNDPALSMWREMGKSARIIGHIKRPPANAALDFGVPFSE